MSIINSMRDVKDITRFPEQIRYVNLGAGKTQEILQRENDT